MIIHIDFEPIGRRVTCNTGTTILEAAKRVGISVISLCGGHGICGSCVVRILSGTVSNIGETEKTHLSEIDLARGFRLACIAKAISDLQVEVPQASLDTDYQLLLSGKEKQLIPDPTIQTFKLSTIKTIFRDLSFDWEYIKSVLNERYGLSKLSIDSYIKEHVSVITSDADGEFNFEIRDGELIDINTYDDDPLGVAFDIGTTKISAYLVNLYTGDNLATTGLLNPQFAYGEDVMSRITYAIEGGGNNLQECAIEALNQLIQGLNVDSKRIIDITVVANTAMHHLLLGLPVQQLGKAPYQPSILNSLDIKARDLGIKVSKGAYIHFLPIIAGFIGSDCVGMILATDMDISDETVLGIDIGTNTEMCLVSGGEIIVASCASGPSFEGAGLKFGMRATVGAIDKVTIDDNGIDINVIGDTQPKGICGSGVLDFIRQLHSKDIIDGRGRLKKHPLVRKVNDGLEVVLVNGNDTSIKRDIVVTQQDIENIQFAKAAIRAGINVLIGEAGITAGEIESVIIAGGFGNFMDIDSAIYLGMFPPLSPFIFQQVGNAAGIGAKLALVSRSNRIRVNEIANRVKYIELTTHQQFAREFAYSLLIN